MASAFPKGKQNEKISQNYISSMEDILNRKSERIPRSLLRG
jgi:RNase P subunit RPR2